MTKFSLIILNVLNDNYVEIPSRQGVCSIYPYQKWKKTEVKEEEVNDTG